MPGSYVGSVGLNCSHQACEVSTLSPSYLASPLVKASMYLLSQSLSLSLSQASTFPRLLGANICVTDPTLANTTWQTAHGSVFAYDRQSDNADFFPLPPEPEPEGRDNIQDSRLCTHILSCTQAMLTVREVMSCRLLVSSP